jgi:hypothetical protein
MGAPIILIALIFLGFGFSATSHAGSAIYKHVDNDGRITFTNRPVKGGQKIRPTPRPSQSHTASIDVSRHFPKESVNVQKRRDIKRREILEHELATEMKLFSETREKLSLMRHDHENLQQKEIKRHFKNKLMRHEHNILALKKELKKL